MKCWPFSDLGFRSPIYEIELNLFLTAKGNWHSTPLKFIVDTGFDGDILIAEDIFESLGFFMFEEASEDWDMGETISGEHLILRSSFSEVQLNDSCFHVRVETFPDNKENLVGRGLLNHLLSEINGFNNEFCCSPTQNEERT